MRNFICNCEDEMRHGLDAWECPKHGFTSTEDFMNEMERQRQKYGEQLESE